MAQNRSALSSVLVPGASNMDNMVITYPGSELSDGW